MGSGESCHSKTKLLRANGNKEQSKEMERERTR